MISEQEEHLRIMEDIIHHLKASSVGASFSDAYLGIPTGIQSNWL